MALSTISGTTGITDATITSAKLADFSAAVDLNGVELLLDADQDTSISADTDDQIDIKIGGADDFQFTANTFTALAGSSVVIPDSGLTLGSTAVTATAAELNLLDGVSGLVQADLTKLAAIDATAAEVNLLNGVSGLVQADLTKLAAVDATATEINLIDGGTARGTDALASGDGILINDAGTMKMTNVDTVKTFMQSGLSSFDPDGAVTINDTGADVDFRVESNNQANMLFVDGGNDRVGIGQASPTSPLHVLATAAGQTVAKFESNQAGSMIVDIDPDTDRDGFLQFSEGGTKRWDFWMNGSSGTNQLKIRDEDGDTRLELTQGGLGLSQFTAKGWCNVNMSGTQAVRDSHNVSSISDQGTGLTRVNWDVDLGNQHNYVPVAMAYRGAYVATYTLDQTSWDADVRNDGGGMEDTQYMTVVAFSD